MNKRMGNMARRAAFLLAGAAIGLPVVVVPLGGEAHAQAAARSHVFAIPAQPLAASLRALSSQTGLQIAYGNSAISGAAAPAVNGRMSAEAALSLMLSGSGLSYRFTGANTVTVIGAGAAGAAVGTGGGTVLGTIDVTGGSTSAPGINEISVTQEDLDRINPSDLQDIFAAEPGVSVGSSIPMSQKVYVHGVEETNLAVTIDGGRQNNKIFHHNGTNLIDPSLLKAVSIDAGVAPADAGPGALGGAIAYETKDAADLLAPGQRFGGMVRMSYDSNGGTVNPSIGAYGKEGGFEYLGFLNYATGSDFEAGDGSKRSGSGANLLSGIGKLAYEAGSGDRFELSYERVRDDSLRPFRANIGGVGAPQPNRRYTLARQNIVFTYTDTTPEGLWDPKAVLAYGVTDLDVLVPYGSRGSTGSLNGKFENRFAFDIGSITAGVDFYNDRAKYSEPDYTAIERATNLGAYAQARLEPWERTRLSFGFRADHQWFTGTDGSEFANGGLSANVSGEYDLTEWLTAKAGYSHVWAGVPLAENFISNPDWDYGDGPLPMTSDNFLAGLAVNHSGFTAEANLFRTNMYDARAAAWGNALTARDFVSKGFDLSAGYNWGNGFVRASYADIDVEIDGTVADTYVGNYIGAPIGQIITLEAAHTFVDWGLTIGGDVRFVLENRDTAVIEGKTLPAYEVANVFVQYVPKKFPNLTLRGEVNNLFNETYADRATYGQEFVGVEPLLEPGRSFKISAAARF